MKTTTIPEIKMYLKIVACLILMAFAYRIYFLSFLQISPVIPLVADDDDASSISPSPPSVAANFTLSGQIPANVTGDDDMVGSSRCDIFVGEWIRDPSGPRYTNRSCHTIEHHQNCMKNGRPDSGYIYWRWRPRDCELPTFDPQRFLDLMRKKSMAFIGDSISRNHVQSLLCVLSQVEQPIEVYHDEEYRSKRWFFDSHKFTLSVIWSPFLTQAKIFEDNDGHASGAVRLHLDEPDSEWANEFGNFDYIHMGAGQWFLKTAIYYENNTIVGCHNCKKENVSELGFVYAYRKALQTALNFIMRSDHTVHALLRTTIPDHFENGEWNTGGYCNRTVPFKEGEIELRYIDTIMRDVELEEMKAVGAMNPSRKGSTLKLFDTTHLSLLRPDGHPGPYRAFHPFDGKDTKSKVQNDCLHWCLPGPIDSWNDLLMNILLRG
ncbi:protein trichome birefringence-like 25 isoform X1 [Cynara cardunculus var. scolymus]|uniref:protein trichome birefringence-like 25 isoform X1 n=1 Tax=Cynara cardunculus var. scolymus TaxID=59895 RepID=UPI000D62AEA5|nr:protein trichome birefringence-like 25 isoform X1 [Cynara cardunculus var. scolymus]